MTAAFPMSSYQRVHAAMAGEPVDCVPLTPIFMAWSANAVGNTYRDYYLDADVLVKSQLAIVERFGLDQVSAISDPWREASAYGMRFEWPANGVGIPESHRLRQPIDYETLRVFDPEAHERTRDRLLAVERLAAAVGKTHSVLGWVEGPMAEYADLRGLEEACLDLMDEPQLFHRAAEVIVASAIRFAEAQVQRGADVIGVGDAAASLIGPDTFEEHVLPWQRKLIDGIHKAGAKVKLHICGNIARIIKLLPQNGADAIDVDWMVPLAEARKTVGDVALCGNADPTAVLLRGTPEQVRAVAEACLGDGPVNGSRFLLQPGCEVPPGTPEANIEAFCAAARGG